MEEDCELRDAAAQLRQLVTALPEREQQILTMRYGLNGAVPQTQQQIAAQFGISRSYVSRIEKRALEKLEAALRKSTPLPACAVRGTNRIRCNCSIVCIL